MTKTKKLLTAAIALGWMLPGAADDHDAEESQKLAIHHVNVKMGHGPAFRDGMEAYSSCLADNDYDRSYSVWHAFDGDRTEFHIVSPFGMWGEMDEDNEVSDACWERDGMREGVFDHLASWQTHYAEQLPDWSGADKRSQVVKLHYFRVEDGASFRSLVSEITGYMKEADYEHQGTWYNVMSAGYWAPDYFVAEGFENFAAMDEERKGAGGVLSDAVGEERADRLWDAFGDTLAEQKGYWVTTLVRQESLGYSTDDD